MFFKMFKGNIFNPLPPKQNFRFATGYDNYTHVPLNFDIFSGRIIAWIIRVNYTLEVKLLIVLQSQNRLFIPSPNRF